MHHRPTKGGQLLLVAMLLTMSGCHRAQTGREIAAATEPTSMRFATGCSGISALLFGPSNKQVIIASLDGATQHWGVACPDQPLIEYQASGKAIWAMASSPDGTTLYCGNSEGEILSYDVRTGKEGPRFVGHANGVESIAISPDGKMLLSGGRDRTVRLWNTGTGREAWRSTKSGGISCVGFMVGKNAVFAGSSDGTAYALDIAGGQTRSSQKYFRPVIAFSPESMTVACTRETPPYKPVALLNDFSILGFHLAEDQVFRLSENSDAVTSIVFSADGRRFVSGSLDKTLQLWDTAEQRRLALYRFDFPVDSVAYSSDGRSMVCGTSDGVVHVVTIP